MIDESLPTKDVRARILSAAAALIAEHGQDAATTRAVSVAAGVQAPTIYRMFGDKRGLLDAVAQKELATYVASKAKRKRHTDPVQEVRIGWDLHVEFGLANPGLFGIMEFAPQAGGPSPAAAAGFEILRQKIRDIAKAGRLRVSEQRAAALVHSACTGTILTLLSQPQALRDEGLSKAAREAVISAIIGEAPVARKNITGLATSLQAALDQTASLSAGERLLLSELLKRIADGS
jgi:AcrR family transcriptional regulator